VWHFSQPFEPSNAVGNLWAVSYPVRKNLVVDGGFDHGLRRRPLDGRSLWGSRIYCRIVFGARIVMAIPFSVALFSLRRKGRNISWERQFYKCEVMGIGTTLSEERIAVHPFDPKTVFLAKHAQHVVLIHFPIALFIAAVAFDLIAQWTKRQGFADAAYYNLLAAAISTFPVIVTGLLAWHFQLEGQKLKGVLLLHLIFGIISTAMCWLVWRIHFRARRGKAALLRLRLAVEFVAVCIFALTGHLGSFLSGVNGPS